jgi:hypothetical protein
MLRSDSHVFGDDGCVCRSDCLPWSCLHASLVLCVESYRHGCIHHSGEMVSISSLNSTPIKFLYFVLWYCVVCLKCTNLWEERLKVAADCCTCKHLSSFLTFVLLPSVLNYSPYWEFCFAFLIVFILLLSTRNFLWISVSKVPDKL